MPNNFGLVGAQAQKPTRFAPIYTGRFSSGIWTNRSPLRDAATTRVTEKYYGPAGDALIAGTNVEITNKLSLARRAGSSRYDINNFTNVDRFYEFRLFDPTTEEIIVMVDQENALYALSNSQKNLVFTKSPNAGQTYMQSVGNILYFADGADNTKWFQTLTTWLPFTNWANGITPFFSTYIIDPNNNMQQLVGTFMNINLVVVDSGVLTVSTTTNALDYINVGDTITFPPVMVATFLENQNLVVTSVTVSSLTFDYNDPAVLSYSGTEPSTPVIADMNGGTSISGPFEPIWSTQIPGPLNNFAGGVTYDGSAIWVNRGSTVQNWGINISKGSQIPKPVPNSPVVTGTVGGGTTTASQTDSGTATTSTVISGFTSTPVTGNVQITSTLNAGATVVSVVEGGGEGVAPSGAVLQLQYSTDTGTSWTTFYVYSWAATGSLVNLPVSVLVSGLANLNTLQIKIITQAYASATGGSALVTATLGAVSAAIGAVVSEWTPSVTSWPAGAVIIDSNGNLQTTVAGGGPGGAVQPIWATTLGSQTADGSVIWTLTTLAAISAFNGGFQYGVALVNSLDDTYSNCTTLSLPTGDFLGEQYVVIPPGAGLPPLNQIDPQSDYVAIFRTTDGQAVPFLIPGPGAVVWTVPLSVYLQSGYHDSTPDTGLNNLISGAIAGENTPPPIGAKALTYHLNRLFYANGNDAEWTSGPDTPCGNGLNGSAPLNFDGLPSLLTRIVPTAVGALAFTVSDVYIITGNGTATNPLQAAVPLLPGIGLMSYNALDMNGGTIGLFTTDNQFVILDPSAGTDYVGFPIGDQLRLNNGAPGQSWNPASVYVAWHVQGEDQAWYVCDGQFGWYRLMPTPAPETGKTWCPFAQIVGGVGALQSVEISPGTHRLLMGPPPLAINKPVLQRDLNVWTDNLRPYPANAVIGSLVLAQPGQIGVVDFVTIEGVRIGTPTVLGLLIDEALPYYTGPIDILKQWVSDPPNLKVSRSLYAQRFYLSPLKEAAAMRHCQIQIIYPETDAVQNETFTITVFGSYMQEL